jgi:two-component system response regulator LytT
MNTVKIGIVEDEAIIADTIAITLEKLGYEVTGSCNTYTAAITMLEKEQPDIVLVDIQLAGRQSGIDLGKTIRESYHIPFIYLTSNSDPATMAEVKETHPDAFLVKPFNKDDLYTSIEVALFNFGSKQSNETQESVIVKDALFLKKEHQLVKVKFDTLSYLKSDHVYVEFHCSDQQRHVVRGKLTDFLAKLPNHFMQVHRRYVVNLQQVDTIGPAELTIKNETLPVSKSFKEELTRAINRI